MPDDELTERASTILRSNRFLSLATADENGTPWACNINYVIEDLAAGSLVYYSAHDSRHSADITQRPIVAGTVFMTEPDLDGLQFTASVSEVVEDELAVVHALYYERNFPTEEERREWMIPIERFQTPHPQRFYRITLGQVWVIDVEGWEVDKVDRRAQIDASRLG